MKLKVRVIFHTLSIFMFFFSFIFVIQAREVCAINNVNNLYSYIVSCMAINLSFFLDRLSIILLCWRFPLHLISDTHLRTLISDNFYTLFYLLGTFNYLYLKRVNHFAYLYDLYIHSFIKLYHCHYSCLLIYLQLFII